jgi:hypothetical protein
VDYVEAHPKLYLQVAHRALRNKIFEVAKTIMVGGIKLSQVLKKYTGVYMKSINDVTSIIYYNIASRFRTNLQKWNAVVEINAQLAEGGRLHTYLLDTISKIVRSNMKELPPRVPTGIDISGWEPDSINAFKTAHPTWETKKTAFGNKRQKLPRRKPALYDQYYGGFFPPTAANLVTPENNPMNQTPSRGITDESITAYYKLSNAELDTIKQAGEDVINIVHADEDGIRFANDTIIQRQ